MSVRTKAGACALVLIATVGLTACGKRGALERPGPLFGHERATTRAADEQVRQAQDPTRPVHRGRGAAQVEGGGAHEASALRWTWRALRASGS